MVKVFVELSGFAATATRIRSVAHSLASRTIGLGDEDVVGREQLRNKLLELEDAGAAGVSFSDPSEMA